MAEGLAAWGRETQLLVLGALVAGMLVAAGPPVVALVLAGLVAAAGGPALRRPLFAVVLGAAVLAGALGAHGRGWHALDRTQLTPVLGAHGHRCARCCSKQPRRRCGSCTRALVRLVAGPGRAMSGSCCAGRAGPRAATGARSTRAGGCARSAPFERHDARRGAHAATRSTPSAATGRAAAGDGRRRRDPHPRRARAVDGLRPPQAALLRGMTLGQDEALDERTREEFRVSSLAHVLAASGQNVALLLACSGRRCSLPPASALRGRLLGGARARRPLRAARRRRPVDPARRRHGRRHDRSPRSRAVPRRAGTRCCSPPR